MAAILPLCSSATRLGSTTSHARPTACRSRGWRRRRQRWAVLSRRSDAVNHPTDGSCIFCKIVAGQIPCFKLLEDDRTIAFMDINPVNPGHALAVAKGHWPTVDVIPPEIIAAIAQTAQKVAKAVVSELKPNGVNLIQANGAGAGQSVPHLHVHIMPRRSGDAVS